MDLVRGNVDFGCNQIVNIAPHIKSGALKAYAVTSDKRTPMLPDVPTTAEAGMPQFNLTVWFGLSAPAGTPAPIIEKLNKALGAALDDPAVAARFAELGYDVVPPEKRTPSISINSTRTKSPCGQKCSAVSTPRRNERRRRERPLGTRTRRADRCRNPPGGGLDRVARALVEAIAATGLVEVPVTVLNVPGGGARKAWTSFVDNHAGDGHVIGISSPNLTTDYLVGASDFEHPNTRRSRRFSPNTSPLRSDRIRR